jgi:hypothetical protein
VQKKARRPYFYSLIITVIVCILFIDLLGWGGLISMSVLSQTGKQKKLKNTIRNGFRRQTTANYFCL